MTPPEKHGHLRKTTTLRIDETIKAELKKHAELHSCTLNREIEERLKASLSDQPITNDQLHQILERIDLLTANTEAIMALIDTLLESGAIVKDKD